jgi:hypothetical protein
MRVLVEASFGVIENIVDFLLFQLPEDVEETQNKVLQERPLGGEDLGIIFFNFI